MYDYYICTRGQIQCEQQMKNRLVSEAISHFGCMPISRILYPVISVRSTGAQSAISQDDRYLSALCVTTRVKRHFGHFYKRPTRPCIKVRILPFHSDISAGLLRSCPRNPRAFAFCVTARTSRITADGCYPLPYL